MKTLNSLFGLKRILGLLLSLGLLIGLIAPSMPAMAAGEPVKIYASPATIAVAATISTQVNVVLKIDNTVPMNGYGFSVTYDAAKLTYVSTENAAFIPTANNSFNPGDHSTAGIIGSIACAFLNPNGPAAVQTGATLVTLHFTVATSSYAVTNVHLYAPANSDVNADPLTTAFTDAVVTIGTPPPPAITSFSPTSGAAGTLVTINGSGFTGTNHVDFAGFNAESYSVVSDSQITARVGIDTVGNNDAGQVNVTTNHGAIDSSGNFTYLDQPTITSFTPTTSWAAQSVVITGTGFINTAANTVVTFGGTAASSVTVDSTHQITAVIGTGATGVVSVTVTGHGNAATLAGFTFNGGGTISSFTPGNGYTGDIVTITGSGFAGTTGAAGVKFGTANAASYTVNGDTQIIAIVGAGATGKITVTDPSGTAQSGTNFTYNQVQVFINPVAQTLTSSGPFSIALSINTNGNKQVRGWQTDITFDATKVQCDSVTEGNFLSTFAAANGATTGSGSIVIDNTAGTIRGLSYAILGAPEAGGATGNGTLATLNFHSVTGVGGTSSISLTNISVFNTSGLAIANVIAAGGAVTATSNIPVNVPVDASLGAQLTFIAPAPVSGWNLVVSAHNNVQRTLNVFANTPWQVTAFDNNSITAGRMTWFDGNNYSVQNAQLANPLLITSGANSINLTNGGVLATGVTAGQNVANGGDIRGLMFDQPVTYTDKIVTSPYSYHIVVTFTASNTGY